jgi:hypothetical protein
MLYAVPENDMVVFQFLFLAGNIPPRRGADIMQPHIRISSHSDLLFSPKSQKLFYLLEQRDINLHLEIKIAGLSAMPSLLAHAL